MSECSSKINYFSHNTGYLHYVYPPGPNHKLISAEDNAARAMYDEADVRAVRFRRRADEEITEGYSVQVRPDDNDGWDSCVAPIVHEVGFPSRMGPDSECGEQFALELERLLGRTGLSIVLHSETVV